MAAASRRPTRLSRQVLVLIVAAALWSAVPIAAAWALVAAYGAAWAIVNAVAVWRPQALELSIGPVARVLLAVVVVAPPAAALWRARGELLEGERLLGLDAHLTDRIRLEVTPSIAPALIRTDHPQTFYVYAPGAVEVRVRLGQGARELGGVALGHGLFRLAYDPRRDGALAELRDEVDATLTVDGVSVTRSMHLVQPRAHPRWLRGAPDGSLAAATSEETDEVAIVGPGGLVQRAAVSDGPVDCGFVSPDRIVVAHRWDGALQLVEARTGELVAEAHLDPFQVRLAVAPGGRRVAVTVDGRRRGLWVVSVPSMRPETFVELDVAPEWIVFGRDEDTLIVSSRRPAALHRLRRDGGGWRTDRSPLLLGRPAVTLARSGDGARVFLATTDYRPDGRPHHGNHFVQDQILAVDTAEWRVISQWLTARRSARQGLPGEVDRGASPMGIEALPNGRLRIAFAGTDEVWRVRPEGVAPDIVPLDEVPLVAPHGVATFADGRWVVSSPAAGTLGVMSDDGTLQTLIRLEPDDATLLARDPAALQRRMGEHVFYEATRSGVSCQSCHLHADSDGALHNIGGGHLAPTLTVRGVGRTAPYLRDGSYARLRDLHDLSQTLYRGFLRRAPGRAVTLEAYVASLPRMPSPVAWEERDIARERAGLRAFVEARCDGCHSFPAFTNLGQHAFGTIFPESLDGRDADEMLDTPSLLSVRWNPPYLSDGRASSLETVIGEHAEGTRHGDASALDEREARDLLWFLEAL